MNRQTLLFLLALVLAACRSATTNEAATPAPTPTPAALGEELCALGSAVCAKLAMLEPDVLNRIRAHRDVAGDPEIRLRCQPG